MLAAMKEIVSVNNRNLATIEVLTFEMSMLGLVSRNVVWSSVHINV
jgi:indole-3-glycerol phosphate synthase